MGIVVEAVHETLGTPVAIKVLKAELAEQPLLVERFLREARSAAQLKGEHVCRVMDFGSEGRVPYLVMELLEGKDLASVLRYQGPLSIDALCYYMLQCCQAIAELNGLGMVHRDLKPSNMFVV